MMRAFLLIASGLLMVPTVPAAAHKLIDAGETVTVAKSDLTVVPAIDWNRINERPGKEAERWTLDGELLNDVLFFAEVEDGDAIFREVDKRNSPLPRFSGNMLLIDLPDFLNSSMRIAKGHQTFSVDSVAPTTFLGQPGVSVSFSTVGNDDIRRRGRAVATIIDGELFMMTFEAPTIYFFERDLPHFEQLVASARLS
ncbi:hypothetical protein KYN89_12780 [Alteriqipengyuania sp. NZ-12B]|uniref:Uncharacterized protein n=1 Tax=Alteriqipengyuania abyssalis TaxID=2860200 RepID=A0ABS7PFS9_9SPHN|nr:hypothetical protein [Alteriqipengyuania abyssalis]MBY8337918.1 hypothetical protein [Alteriqipengyuania abyssalis]